LQHLGNALFTQDLGTRPLRVCDWAGVVTEHNRRAEFGEKKRAGTSAVDLALRVRGKVKVFDEPARRQCRRQ